jgi:hypothetical protein
MAAMSGRARLAWAIVGVVAVAAVAVGVGLVSRGGQASPNARRTGPLGKLLFTRIGFGTNCSYVATVHLEPNGPALAQYGTRGPVPPPTTSPTGPRHHKKVACLFARYDPGVYYTPILLQNGKEVPSPGQVFLYYVMGPGPPSSKVPYPPGLRMTATHYYFTCVFEHKPAAQQPFDCRDSQPNDPRVSVWVNFPTCWDGTGNEPSDVRYATAGTCPSGFEMNLPLLQLQMSWHIADGTGLTFSTGQTFVTSFENFWVPAAMNDLVTNCIVQPRPCGGIINYFHRTPLPTGATASP